MLTRAHGRPHGPAKRGATLAELLVALLLAGAVLGTATGSLLRQQRSSGQVALVTGADAQSRSAAGILAGEIAQLEAGGGDLAVGEASDSAFQFRSLVATSIACVSGIGAATLAPDAAGVPVGRPVSAPRAGDSLWWRADSVWRAVRVEDAVPAQVTCSLPLAVSGKAWRLALGVADTIQAGAVIRLTRPARYAFYRSSDGTWQLGYREWSESAHRFASPQPVAGPFILRAGPRRSGIRYFDSANVELPLVNGSVDAARVARMRFITLTLVKPPFQPADTVRVDSADVALARPA